MKQKRGISRYLLAMLLLLSSVVIASCGGGGGGDGGGGGGGGGPTPLATGTFTKTADMGSANYTGLLDADTYAHYQYLYLASIINGAGRITGLAIKYRSTMDTAVTCPNATIKLSHSNLANLTGTFANNLGTGQGSQTTVLNNATMTFPAGAAGSWQTILLATPFDYNGKDNLIIDVERTGACSGIVFDDVNTPWPYTAGVFTFTNGSATGIPVSWAANGKLVFAGGDNSIYTQSATAGSADVGFTTTANQQKFQNLYLASEVNGSGPITGIGFPVCGDSTCGAATTAQTYTVTVKLGHSSLTNLTATYANNYDVGAPVTVINNLQFTVPAGVPPNSQYVWLPVTNVFTYNGTNNLLVEVEVTSASGITYWPGVNTASNTFVYGTSGSPTALAVAPVSFRINFRFNGGTMNFITAGSSSLVPPFDLVTGLMKTHWLYDAASLGTGGSISKIAFRLNNNSVASDYSNFTVTIGQTSNNLLSGVLFANDFDVSANVLSTSTFSIPAGMLAGDWIEIPLSGTFSYDPTKNLVVEITTSAATAGNSVRAEFSATRFPSHISAATAPGATVPTVIGNYGVDMRFWVQKYN
jgi:hypothetical protein